ncbi:unnamed protein product [Moneuplotes crassus]|uniref:RING-type domain-containing protein n=1 Tax=Euplotes crassus TaxID=5936 RepID=A0AAD1UJ58_EUPCR|nr:unnamed protein product [Moneuplotes crassus]
MLDLHRSRGRIRREFTVRFPHFQIPGELGTVAQFINPEEDNQRTCSDDILRSLKNQEIKSDNISEFKEEICSICLGQFEIGSKAITLKCNHKFHCDCIRRWLQQRQICPYCREEISLNQSS